MSAVGDYVDSGATVSSCGLYRYNLWRMWDFGGRTMVVIGLNPSTADGTKDDPTIRRCVSFAKRERCDALVMLNLFAFRATNPMDLVDSYEAGIPIVGPDNDLALREHSRDAAIVVAAWGVHGCLYDRDKAVLAMELPALRCLGLTKAGYPRHPLYLPGSAPLQPLHSAGRRATPPAIPEPQQ